ncbi:unnamed protein product [Coregonus sp. 'balchen']|nr:unnamed protein product [Coregonus sp. 'balchen']
MSRISSRLILTCIVWFTLYVSEIKKASSVTAQENDELPEFKFSEDVGSDMENIPKFVRMEDLESQPKRQYKTAEIADAVMGTELPVNPAGIESLIPKNVKDFQTGFSPPCDDEAKCPSPLNKEESMNSEPMEPVTLEMVHVDAMANEEQNSTETTKTYKVNCDKRNITGMDNFTVQVLNASQVIRCLGLDGVPECKRHRVLSGVILHYLVPVLCQSGTSLQRTAPGLPQHALPGTGRLPA